jgi:hypothetical protein
MTLQAAALEAKLALENGWREVIECPYCTRGSTHHPTHTGRCAYCQGVGRIYRDTLATPDQSPPSGAGPAAFKGSSLDSSDPAPGA